MTHATDCRPAGKGILCAKRSVCMCAHGCGVRARTPLEKSSKRVITDGQMNSAFYFLRQMSGLALRTQGRLWNVWRVQEEDLGMLPFGNDSCRRSLITLCLRWVVSDRVFFFFFLCARHRGRTLLPLNPWGPGAPASPVIPWFVLDKSLISEKWLTDSYDVWGCRCSIWNRGSRLTSFPGTPGLPGNPSSPVSPWDGNMHKQTCLINDMTWNAFYFSDE